MEVLEDARWGGRRERCEMWGGGGEQETEMERTGLT